MPCAFPFTQAHIRIEYFVKNRNRNKGAQQLLPIVIPHWFGQAELSELAVFCKGQWVFTSSLRY
jgi:hypothetical protein